MKPKVPALRADPQYVKAFATIMSRIEDAIGARRPAESIVVCVAGGAALHFYTGSRTSTDIDAKVMARILIDPAELQVAYDDSDGHARLLYFDTQYNDTFALLHRDAYDDALPIEVEGVDAKKLTIKLLAPVDLAVSKLSRFSEQDQLDIQDLARAGLIDAPRVRKRAESALPDYVGRLESIKTSIRIACRMIEEATRKTKTAGKQARRPAEPS